MKKEDLYESIGEIDEDLLARSENAGGRKTSGRVLGFRPAAVAAVSAVAACLCVAAALTALPFLRGGRDGDLSGIVDGAHNGKVDTGETDTPGQEIGKFPNGELANTAFSYPELDYAGKRYTVGSSALPDEYVGERLGSTVLQGSDMYLIAEDRYVTATANAEIFRIQGISGSCALALRVGEDPVCFPYVNSWYAPSTLGQFIEDLDLANTLSFGPVYGGNNNIIYVGRPTGSGGNSAAFTGLPAEAAWSILLSDGSAKAVKYDSVEPSGILYDISVNLSRLGYHNVSMAVTADGYLTTNLLDTGKAFYIGRDAVKAFADYMEASFEAREIPPADGPDALPVPE